MVQDVVVPESLKMLVSVRDYPRILAQLRDWFPDEVACREYLEDIRWRDTLRRPIRGDRLMKRLTHKIPDGPFLSLV